MTSSLARHSPLQVQKQKLKRPPDSVGLHKQKIPENASCLCFLGDFFASVVVFRILCLDFSGKTVCKKNGLMTRR